MKKRAIMNPTNKLNTATNTHTSNHQKNALSLSLLVAFLPSLTTLISTSSLVYADTTVSSSASANASITVAPTIRVTLTGGDLVIDNLIPGSSSDSNIITAAVTTNAAYGYNLLATTGTSATNTNLTHSSNSSFYFTSLSSNKATLNDFSDNTWGYSYSKDNGTTWISGSDGATMSGYNGLPKDNDDNGATGITLISTDTYSATNAIQFKIGAKASTAQASGTYNGVVNFYAVTKPKPVTFDDAFAAAGKTKTDGYYVMQDASSSICSAVDEGQTTTLLDSRGNGETYAVAKLKDGKCWMTENLNLAGGTALSADDTDVTSAYISSFSTSNNLTKTGYAIVLPASSTSGFNINDYSYVYNSGNKTTNCTSTTSTQPCYSYYSWDAATLGSGRSISTDNTDAPYSICPKGWKLPSTYNGSGTAAEATDFIALMIAYGGSNSIRIYNDSTSPTGATMYSNIGPGSIPNFLLAGGYYDGSLFGSNVGFYWSSTSVDTRYGFTTARMWQVNPNTVSLSGTYPRYGGLSVRCLLK